MRLSICISFPLNHLPELSALCHLPFVPKRSRFKVFQHYLGRQPHGYQFGGLSLPRHPFFWVTAPFEQQKEQIDFLSEQKLISHLAGQGWGRVLPFTEEREQCFLELVSALPQAFGPDCHRPSGAALGPLSSKVLLFVSPA